MDTHHNPSLDLAVQYLYGQGVVKRDKDIADKTGYNKSTVSSYISGRTKMSADFQTQFERVFKLKLDDFKAGGAKEVIKNPDSLQLITETVLQTKAEIQTMRQLIVEVLASTTSRSVMDVQLVAERSIEHNLSKILHELKQG